MDSNKRIRSILCCILIIIVIGLVSFTKNMSTKKIPKYPFEKTYIEEVIQKENYPWLIAEEFSQNENNNSFLLEYSGEEKGQLYINSLISEDARFVGVNIMNDAYVLGESNQESKNFLFNFAFELFGSKRYIKIVASEFNEFIGKIEKKSVSQIMWHNRFDDLVVRVGAKYPGYGNYRINSVWIYDIDAYEQKNRKEAESNLERIRNIDEVYVHENASIREISNNNESENIYIINAYNSESRNLSETEFKKLKEIDPRKYLTHELYEMIVLDDGNSKLNVIILDMPLTKDEELLTREYHLTYVQEQDLYIVNYSLKIKK